MSTLETIRAALELLDALNPVLIHLQRSEERSFFFDPEFERAMRQTSDQLDDARKSLTARLQNIEKEILDQNAAHNK